MCVCVAEYVIQQLFRHSRNSSPSSKHPSRNQARPCPPLSAQDPLLGQHEAAFLSDSPLRFYHKPKLSLCFTDQSETTDPFTDIDWWWKLRRLNHFSEVWYSGTRSVWSCVHQQLKSLPFLLMTRICLTNVLFAFEEEQIVIVDPDWPKRVSHLNAPMCKLYKL